jgi:hypothetical protein
MNRGRCLGAAAVILLLVIVSPDQPSPLGKVPLVREASAQSFPSGNETGWGNFSVTMTSGKETFIWVGSYTTLTACTGPGIPQAGPDAWDGCGYAVASLDGTTSEGSCDPDLQYLWSVDVSVTYNTSSIGLEVSLSGPVSGEIALGCGPGNNSVPPPLIPTYCCNESGLVASGGVLSGVATYSKTGTDAELPGYTVHWTGMVSITPGQVTTSTTPEFNANALALALTLPLAVVALIAGRAIRRPALDKATDRSAQT